MLLRVASIALAASLLAVPVARAQTGPVKIGVCNVQKVWEAMEERKALNEQNTLEREKLKQEAAQRQAAVKEIDDLRKGLKPGSQVYEEKTKLLMEKAIELDVWARLKDAELNRKQKEQTKMLYDKIADGCKDVAETRGLDLVLVERKPEMPTNPQEMDQLKPEQVQALLAQRDVLYSNKNADITELVTAMVNKKYATPAAAPAATGTPAAPGTATPPAPPAGGKK